MLIPFSELVRKHGLRVSGILHIGAHMCEESTAYTNEGVSRVVWIEANPELVKLQYSQRSIKLESIHQCLASDVDGCEVPFYITNNGQSSSMLELGEHAKFYPEIVVTSTIMLHTKRIETLVREEKIDTSSINFCNLDIQGAELSAIKGMGEKLIAQMNAFYVEVNTAELYKSCVQLPELDSFLHDRGFKRVQTEMTHARWGDALYVRNKRNREDEVPVTTVCHLQSTE